MDLNKNLEKYADLSFGSGLICMLVITSPSDLVNTHCHWHAWSRRKLIRLVLATSS